MGGVTANVVRLAALTGRAYAEAIDPYLPTQALVLPADVARGFVGWADHGATDADPDDVVMLRYLASNGGDPASGGAVLTGLLTVPYLSFVNPMGRCLVRTAPGAPWRAEPADDTLRRHGIDGLAAAHAEALARPAVAGDELCERFGRRPVLGVWTTAVALGVLAAGIPMTHHPVGRPAPHCSGNDRHRPGRPPGTPN